MYFKLLVQRRKHVFKYISFPIFLSDIPKVLVARFELLSPIPVSIFSYFHYRLFSMPFPLPIVCHSTNKASIVFNLALFDLPGSIQTQGRGWNWNFVKIEE